MFVIDSESLGERGEGLGGGGFGACSNPGGDTPIHKLYRDVPPVRVWFFDRPLINMVSNSKIFENFV